MTFDINKLKKGDDGFWHCRTRDGREAKLAAINGTELWSIVGWINGSQCGWTKEGRWYVAGENSADLITDGLEDEQEKRLPCPFCGGEKYSFEHDRDGYVHCYCINCFSTSPRRITNHGATEAWNNRAPQQAEPTPFPTDGEILDASTALFEKEVMSPPMRYTHHLFFSRGVHWLRKRMEGK